MNLQHCFVQPYCFVDNLKLKTNLSVFDSQTRAAEAVRVPAEKLIQSMFPLHVLRCSNCIYFSSLGVSSLEDNLAENKDHIENQTENKTITVFRHFLSGPPPRQGPPRANLDFMFVFFIALNLA